jgi:O-methyltransferase
MKTLIHRLLPVEFQPPRHLPRQVLATLGYFRFRTWLAARGDTIQDSELYRPLFSPWEGDSTFDSLYRLIAPHTLVSRDRCWVLWKTLQQALCLSGELMECGVFRGGTALLEAATLQESGQDRPLHLFDSFAGMPETAGGIDKFKAGDFANTSAERAAKLLAPYPFVRLHVGFIPDTFAGHTIERVAWAHVDVDIYQSVRECIEYIYPRLVPGGYLIFDDYGFPSCPSARKAVDDAFAARSEVPLCLPTGQCLVVKLPNESTHVQVD